MICHLYTVPYRACYYHGIMLACKFCMHLQAAKSVSSILWPIANTATMIRQEEGILFTMECCYDALRLSSPLSRGLRVARNTHEVAQLTCMRSEDLHCGEELWQSMQGHRNILE